MLALLKICGAPHHAQQFEARDFFCLLIVTMVMMFDYTPEQEYAFGLMEDEAFDDQELLTVISKQN